MKSFGTELHARVEQHLSAEDIGFKKHLGAFYRTVDMAFGCEINDNIKRFLLKKFINACPVANIDLDKAEIIVFKSFF